LKVEFIRVVELSRANCDEIEILVGLADRRFQFECPAGLAVASALHSDDGSAEAHQAIEAMAAGIIGKISMDLRPLRPLGIRGRHGLVGVAVEVLRALGLNIGIGAGRIPDAAEIGSLLHDRDRVPLCGKRLACGEPGNAGADHANLLLADHLGCSAIGNRHPSPSR